MERLKWLLAMTCVPGLFTAAGCGGGHATSAMVRSRSAAVKLSCTISRTGSARGVVTRAPGISNLNITVSGTNMDAITNTVAWTGNGTLSQTLQVPVGPTRSFELDALDASGNVLFTGQAVQPISQTGPNAVEVALAPPGSPGVTQISVTSAPHSFKPLFGVCFSPYMDGQDATTGIDISQDQIDARLAAIAGDCTWLRTYSSTHGLQLIGHEAHQRGFKVAAGVWLDKDPASNAAECLAAIQTAQNHDCDILCVGSEVLQRGDLAAGAASDPPANLTNTTNLSTLVGYIKAVRQAVQGTGVSIAVDDTYVTILNTPAVCQQVDDIFTNIYPYWEGISIDQAWPFTQTKYNQVVQAYPGKQVWLGEVGWPTSGDTLGNAVPSEDNASTYFYCIQSWTQTAKIPTLWFESLDEQWKVASEGAVGGTWGLRASSGAIKPCYHLYVY